MADGYTISMSQGDHAEEHSRRSYTPMSADKSLEDRNIVIYDCGDDKEHFNEFFRPAIEAYNARQKRADRKKSLDYYDALLNGTEGYGKGKQQEVPIYDDVIQIGNRDTNGVTRRTFDVDHWRGLKKEGKFHEASDYMKKHLNDDPDKDALEEILLESCREIYNESANSREYRKANGLPPGKYDNILIHRMILHADEPNGTIHVDMGYTIFTDEGNTMKKNGRQNGLSTRVSMTKGMAKMGFRTTQDEFALEQFRNAIKDRIQEKMEERGYQRDIKGEHRRHLKQGMYEAEARAREAEAKVEEIQQREDAVASDEVEIKRRKKKQDDRDSEQEAREEKQNKRDASLKKKHNQIAKTLITSLQVMRPDLFDEKTGKYIGDAASLGALANEVEAEFQRREDSMEAQKRAMDEERSGLQSDREEARKALETFREAGRIQSEIQQEAPQGFVEWAKTDTLRLPVKTVDLNAGSKTYMQQVPKRDAEGKAIYETLSHYEMYERYLQSQQRKRELTTEEQEIINEAEKIASQYE